MPLNGSRANYSNRQRMCGEILGGIDTVHLWLLDPLVIQDTDQWSKTHDPVRGEYFTRNHLNLRLRTSERGTSIQGSLPEYYLGNNAYTLTQNQTQEAFDQLSEDLRINILDAKVNRVDWAVDLVTDYPPYQYDCHLGDSRLLGEKIKFRKTSYYENTSRTLSIYDKGKKVKKDKKSVPEGFNTERWIRIESRIKQPKKHLKMNIVMASDLCSESSRDSLFKGLQMDFKSIHKIKPYQADTPAPRNVHEFYEQSAAELTSITGPDVQINKINNWRKSGDIDSQKATKYRKIIRNLQEQYGTIDPTSLADELSRKLLIPLCLLYTSDAADE